MNNPGRLTFELNSVPPGDFDNPDHRNAREVLLPGIKNFIPRLRLPDVRQMSSNDERTDECPIKATTC
jgi:hypothetical protein